MPDGRSTLKRDVFCPDCHYYLASEDLADGEVLVICGRCRARVAIRPGCERVLIHGKKRRRVRLARELDTARQPA